MADKQKKFEWIRYPGQGRGVALGLLVCLTFGTALESPTAGILFGVILGGGIEASAYPQGAPQTPPRTEANTKK